MDDTAAPRRAISRTAGIRRSYAGTFMVAIAVLYGGSIYLVFGNDMFTRDIMVLVEVGGLPAPGTRRGYCKRLLTDPVACTVTTTVAAVPAVA